MALGSYPSHRYSRSWMTQRLLNRAPEWADVRKFPNSLGFQMMNPIGLELQNTFQQLNRERNNSFVSTADIKMLDLLYEASLGVGMSFAYTENKNGERIYVPPTVYATINNTEYEITQAQENDLETLAYDILPSRIDNPEISYVYQEIIPETTVGNLGSVTPNAISIPGHVYVTLKNNLNWKKEFNNRVFYSKILITGTTRKGTVLTETIPLGYNGTFKSLNEWQEITSVFVAYLSSSATITVETFPFGRESYLDTFNIFVPSLEAEKFQFLKLQDKSWGSSFLVESFVLDKINLVRDSNIDDKDPSYEIELLSEGEENVDILDFVQLPNSRFIYAIDNQSFYVYDVSLPYPYTKNLTGISSDYKIEIYSDQWILSRGDSAQIRTRNLGEFEVPIKYRWHVLDPDGLEYYMGSDGSLWPTTTNAWIDNTAWEENLWHEQNINFEITKSGEWIVSLESAYSNPQTAELTILTSKFLFFAPVITPEVEFLLPVELSNSTNIGLDSDGNVWLLRYDGVHKLDVFFDYYIVDYEENKIYLKEEYSSVRIVTNE